jgi:molybdopterin-guanine dinucleotide biosynthesis protein A
VTVDGLVLAGGRSRRFGSDKRLAVLDGKPLLEIAVGKLRSVCSGRIMIAAGATVGEVEPTKGAVVIADCVQSCGPLAGILSGLLRSQSGVLVLACDLPWVRISTLRSLARLGSRINRAVAVRSSRGWEPLVAYYPVSAAPVIRARIQGGALAVHKLLDCLGAVSLACATPGELRNVNRPEDLGEAGP